MRYFPNQAIVYFLNGAGQFNKKNYTNAIKSLNHGIDIQSDDSLGMLGDMYSMLGDTYNILKEYTRSDSAFEKVLQLEPTNASVMNNYAYYLSVRNANLDKAEKLSKRSLELKPDEATFLDTYGWILYQQHKYKEAKDYIQKAVDANPDNADGTLYEHLGNVYYKLGDKEKAIEYWKKAKDKGSDNIQLDKQIQEQKLYE
jgi:Tfp pilus assembly protein PilF